MIATISMEGSCIDRAPRCSQGKLISRNSPDRYRLRRIEWMLAGYSLITFLSLQCQMTSSSAHASYFLSQFLGAPLSSALAVSVASVTVEPLWHRSPLRDIENINSRLKFFRDENKQRSSSIHLSTGMFSNEMEMKARSRRRLLEINLPCSTIAKSGNH